MSASAERLRSLTSGTAATPGDDEPDRRAEQQQVHHRQSHDHHFVLGARDRPVRAAVRQPGGDGHCDLFADRVRTIASPHTINNGQSSLLSFNTAGTGRSRFSGTRATRAIPPT